MALRTLLAKLKNEPVFTELAGLLGKEARPRCRVTGLWGSARAFFWAGLRERLRRPQLILVPTPEAARDLYDQMRLFLQHPDPEREEIFLFPGREILPYEHALTDMELEGERLEVLMRLARGEKPVIVAAMEQAREILPDPVWLLERTITLARGQHWHLEKLAGELMERGYVRESMVETRGQFAVRGGILDIFPPAELAPWRVEFEGSEVASLRRFSLRPGEKAPARSADEAVISPARMYFPSATELTQGLAQLERQRGREVVRELRHVLEEDSSRPGIENYFPYFIPTAPLWEYFPQEMVVIVDSPGTAKEQAGQYNLRAQERYKEHRQREPLLLVPDKLYYDFEVLEKNFSGFALIETGRLKQTVWPEPEVLPEWSVVVKGTAPLQGNLDLLIQEARALFEQGLELHVISHNRAEEQRLRRLLAERASNLQVPDFLGRFEFHIGHLAEGFQYPAGALVIFTDQEIFSRHIGRPRLRRIKGQAYASQAVSDVLELKPGDLAIHRDHGLAHFQGIVKLGIDGGEHEFVRLAYAGEEKLYVPMDQLRLVEKYTGGERAPRINRLGSSAWERTKQKVKESVTIMARELLDIYAARQVHQAHAFAPDNQWQKEFEEAFPYDETPDQIRAIAEVKKDMERPKPMDRLICGDVGFGKTEVAMRAAFKAVQDGFQVAILVPTTILADQHFATFRERLAAYPLRVEVLMRFKSPQEQKIILRDMAQGAVDIVIGTHRLLGKDVKFRRLGLCVLDEEQHFGVGQKEKLKKIRSTVDVLTLTATPIPRTLYLSMSGIRDISVIETPPLNRLPIRTQVMEYSEPMIREAILRELSRQGQVFFIHNRVQTIWKMAERVKKMAPEARVAVAHGQMTKGELEPVMERFLARAEDILVSTTIVESGLDMPNVNTIIINRADALGMSQLYQLRGRVGRADRQAYAYLFYPLGGAATGDAEKRLTTLQEFTELGSGIKIAMRDLEIRGAGDVLGREQSGQVAAVGFETYCSMLEEAVGEMRGQGEEAPAEVRVAVPLDAYLPADYVPDAITRLNFYKRLAGAGTLKELQAVSQEIETRCGSLPEPAKNLLEVAELKIVARAAKISEIMAGERVIQIRWAENFQPPSNLVGKLLADRSWKIRFLPGEPAGLEMGRPSRDLLKNLKELISKLAGWL
ncbi:transcription-repair coupling factor [bacterium]|nr:transcription-repair coupling factor [bacterium]